MLTAINIFMLIFYDNQFTDAANHINDIESFWFSAKRRLQKFNGEFRQTFACIEKMRVSF